MAMKTEAQGNVAGGPVYTNGGGEGYYPDGGGGATNSSQNSQAPMARMNMAYPPRSVPPGSKYL